MKPTIPADCLARTIRKATALIVGFIFTVGLASPALAIESGTLMLIGDILSFRERTIWKRIFELSGGQGVDVVVIGAAHDRPTVYGRYAVKALERYGPFVELLPVAVSAEAFGKRYQDIVSNPVEIAQVKQARVVFFVGGAPQRLSTVLFKPDGTLNPLGEAVRYVFDTGGLIVGGIPGPGGAYTDIDALDVLNAGRIRASQLYRGLGLIGSDWLVDQAFFSPGRFAETIVAMRELSLSRTIGVAPNASAIVRNGELQVLGKAGAMVVELLPSASPLSDKPFSIKGARLSYLGDGDKINLKTLEITPHRRKLDGFLIDPNAADHRPRVGNGPVTSDIFAPNRPLQLIIGALESSTRQALGLALENSHRQRDGFQFRFYTDKDTLAWLSLDSGEERYTVRRIRLDIVPISRKQANALLRCGEKDGADKCSN